MLLLFLMFSLLLHNTVHLNFLKAYDEENVVVVLFIDLVVVVVFTVVT